MTFATKERAGVCYRAAFVRQPFMYLSLNTSVPQIWENKIVSSNDTQKDKNAIIKDNHFKNSHANTCTGTHLCLLPKRSLTENVLEPPPVLQCEGAVAA